VRTMLRRNRMCPSGHINPGIVLLQLPDEGTCAQVETVVLRPPVYQDSDAEETSPGGHRKWH